MANLSVIIVFMGALGACLCQAPLAVLPTTTTGIPPQQQPKSQSAERRNAPMIQEAEVLSMLLKKYDKSTRPSPGYDESGAKKPVNVTANMLIRDVAINDATMEMSVTITLRMNWTDERLSFDSGESIKQVSSSDPAKFWIPDIFFLNEKNARLHNVLTPNVYMRIYPSGLVMFSTRISLVMQCPLGFRWFPMDRQTCPINFASYGYTTSEMNFSWKDDTPVQVSPRVLVPKYEIKGFRATEETLTVATGTYTTLTVTLDLKRVLGSYLTHYFFPTTLLVALSWLAFWFRPDVSTPRVVIGLAALLPIYYLLTETTEPAAVSYVTALDVWGITCALLVLLSLLETVTVNFFYREQYVSRYVQEVNCTQPSAAAPLLEHGTMTSGKSVSEVSPRGQRIDLLSRMAFPAIFVVFMIVYFAVCLIG